MQGHYDLDTRIAQWRTRQERNSSLSPRELDELEDHLRAHVDLEMELNATLGPAQAFRAACQEIGSGAALSKEFAKVGGARWRKMFVQGWVLYVVSFLLPSAELGFDAGYRFVLDVMYRFVLDVISRGWLFYPHILGLVFLSNLAMLTTIRVLPGRRRPSGRRVKWVLGLTGIGAMGAAVFVAGLFMFSPENRSFWDGIARFGTGYWSWTASLILVATALHLRARDWASVKPTISTRVPDHGACQ